MWQTFSHRYSHRTRTTLAQARSTRQLTGTHGSMHRLYFFNIFLHMALLCKVMCMVEMIGIAQLQPRAGCALAARRRARAQSARSAARARSSAFVFVFMSCGHVHVHVRSRAHAHVHVHARAHACVRMHARSPRARPRGARRRSARALRCPHACTRAPRAHGILYVASRHDTPHGMAWHAPQCL